ncbi:thermonuclease family protein [Cypionkella sp. TWP1-2-1b2]|uniref:thermonuclease family protein n=1 Tax=Cypionkella sp. TWP1-2-1b2 TaxID=2804675 RepID=UPI003CEA72F6
MSFSCKKVELQLVANAAMMTKGLMMIRDFLVASIRSGRRIAPVFLMAVSVVLAGPLAAETRSVSGKVSRVTDGDTFHLSGLDPAIRVWGLDAPERKQAGGSEATRAMRSLISGATLDCQVRDIDRYHRLVAQRFLPDGRDIAAEMIYMGVATEYCRYSRGYYRTC